MSPAGPTPRPALLICRYSVDGRPFEERITFPPAGRPARAPAPAPRAAPTVPPRAAGTARPSAGPRGWCSCWPASPTTRRPRRPSSTWASTAVTDTERAFLRVVLSRRPGRVRLPQRPGPVRPAHRGPVPARRGSRACGPRPRRPADRPPRPRPLVPFGGGIDSIVTVEMIRAAGRARAVHREPARRPVRGDRAARGGHRAAQSSAPSARSTRSCCAPASWASSTATSR